MSPGIKTSQRLSVNFLSLTQSLILTTLLPGWWTGYRCQQCSKNLAHCWKLSCKSKAYGRFIQSHRPTYWHNVVSTIVYYVSGQWDSFCSHSVHVAIGKYCTHEILTQEFPLEMFVNVLKFILHSSQSHFCATALKILSTSHYRGWDFDKRNL